MKIAYYIYWNDGFESGVIKKITGQIEFWKSKNNEVKLFIYTQKNSTFENDYKTKKKYFSFDLELFNFSGRINELKNSSKIYDAINNYNPDLIYMRECKFYPYVYKLNKKFTSIVELNSIIGNEQSKKSIQYWYNKLTFSLKFKYINAFIAVTNEIAEHKTFSKFKAPKYIIGNGIDLSKYRITKVENNTIDLVFIGTDGQKWHGVDKILELAKVKTNWHFHIIGISNTKLKLNNITFYGVLNKNEYQIIFNSIDVAIGTLALHRKKMEEACPLKTREYLANGLPVIIGYRDVDFLEEVEYICELPNTKTNLINNIKKIENFVAFWKDKRINKNIIKHIDTSHKEKLRLDIFKTTIENAK